MNTPSLPTPTRRQVVGAAAWTLPVIAVAGAAPAFASSTPVACTPGPLVPARRTWTITTGSLAEWDKLNTGWLPFVQSSPVGPCNPAGQDWHSKPEGFVSSADQAQANTWTTIVVEYEMPVVRGASYTLGASIDTMFANGEGGAERQDVTLEIINGSQTITVAKIATDGVNAAMSDADMVAAGFTVEPEWNAAKTHSSAFTAESNGTATLRYTFRMHPVPVVKTATGQNTAGWYANRDMWVSLPVAELVACPA